MHNTLSLIIDAKKKRIEVLKKNREEVISLSNSAPSLISFKSAICRKDKISFIAEVKQASPSAGILRKEFSAVDIAKIYKKGKANALSVLTEEDFFLGKTTYISNVKKAVRLPILRKDFILDEVQVYESRAIGADAILLIMGILDEDKFKRLYTISKDLGMDVLAEVHSEKELRKIIKLGADIVGINNRNLNTLNVDIATTEKLIPFIPSNVVKVSESGIKTFKDMLLLKGLGVNAVLVGESLMKSEDIGAKLEELNIDG